MEPLAFTSTPSPEELKSRDGEAADESDICGNPRSATTDSGGVRSLVFWSKAAKALMKIHRAIARVSMQDVHVATAEPCRC
jgi:hypothetical protein